MVEIQTKKKRLSRQQRTVQILEVAKELFSQKGYQYSSMDELARRTGVSKPVIYELMGSKEQLFKTLMDFELDELEQKIINTVQASDELRSKLANGLKAFFEFVYEHRQSWQAFISATDYPITEAVKQARQRQARLVASLIKSSYPPIESKSYSEIIQAVAWAINGAAESLANWWLNSQLFSLDELVEFTLAMINPNFEFLTAFVIKLSKEKTNEKRV